MALPLVTLITPTGSRPAVFALCEKYMVRQTWDGPMQWIVVDDSLPATELTIQPGRINQEYYRGPKAWRPGINTQRPNLDEALKHVKGDYIFMIEDDDWYAPDYIATWMKFLLSGYDIVGEGHSKYYNLAARMYKGWGNFMSASLCQTGFHRKVLDMMDEAVNQGDTPYFDMTIWAKAHAAHLKRLMVLHIDRVVGMKGLPGRSGIGGGHRDLKAQGFIEDPGLDQLREWIGAADTTEYIKLFAQAQIRNENTGKSS